MLLAFKLIDRLHILWRGCPELSPVHKNSWSHESLLFPPALLLLSFCMVLGFDIHIRRLITQNLLLSYGLLSFCEEYEIMLTTFDNRHAIHVESAATIDSVALMLWYRANLDTLVSIPFLRRRLHVLVKLRSLGISSPFSGLVSLAL